MSQLTERYAVALFELAQENDCVISWQSQAKLVINSIPEDSERFFQSILVSRDEKKEVLQKGFSKSVDDLLMNFLCLLVDKGRFHYVKGILNNFNSLCNQSRNIEEGILYTARPYEASQIEEIEKALSQQRGKVCELKNKIDQRLISGFKIMIENEVIDSSMQNSIHSLKRELLKETR